MIIKQDKTMLTVLMITISLDFMGFLLVFPLFPDLFIAKTSVLVPASASLAMRYFYYALALATWPAGCFFGTAYFGALSDRMGLKRIILLCLAMVSFSYALQAIAIHFATLMLFFLSRVLQGFFGGNYDIVQAAVADMSSPNDKARNMSLIALAASFGVVLGPLISAFAGSSHFISWFTILTPFWIAAFLALFNLIWIGTVFKETYQAKSKEPLKLSKIFTAFLFIFTDLRVRRLAVIYFLLAVGWGLYVQAIPLLLQKLFGFGPHMIGFFFLVLGVGLFLALQYIQPWLIKQYRLKSIYIYSMYVVTLFLLLAGLLPLLDIEWVTVFFVAIFHVSAYGCLLAIISNTVTIDEQGRVMGGTGAVGSLAFALNAFLIAYLSAVNVVLPVIIASFMYFLSGIILSRTAATHNLRQYSS